MFELYLLIKQIITRYIIFFLKKINKTDNQT
jgi:hypothetical protein